jgi:hypothetical protein
MTTPNHSELSYLRFAAADARRRGLPLARLWHLEQYLAHRLNR